MKSNHKSSEYIFPNTLNKMMSETCLKRKLSYVLKDINLKLKSDTQKDVSENEKANCEYENINGLEVWRNPVAVVGPNEINAMEPYVRNMKKKIRV